MFEVLMFLFENYMNGSSSLNADNDTIVVELENVGFDRYEINRALVWLEGLAQFQTDVQSAPMLMPQSFRHYMPEESDRLGIAGKGFLLYLEQLGILDPATRETVIDRIMALDSYEVDFGRIKWVVLMVLFTQPNKKSALSLLQEMILAETFDVVH